MNDVLIETHSDGAAFRALTRRGGWSLTGDIALLGRLGGLGYPRGFSARVEPGGLIAEAGAVRWVVRLLRRSGTRYTYAAGARVAIQARVRATAVGARRARFRVIRGGR